MKCLFNPSFSALFFTSVLTFSSNTHAQNNSVPSFGENDLQKALRFVEEAEKQAQCSKVLYLDVALQHKRWKQEALLSLEVANLMTALWRTKDKKTNLSIAADDTLLYRMVRSIIMYSSSAFGSGICFDKHQYKDYKLFCPYAFKNANRNGSVEVFDIAMGDGNGYDYNSDPDAIWWKDPKRKALTLKPDLVTEYYAVRLNSTAIDKLRNYTLPVAKYSNGVWTRPYYDCFGGKIWMVTYLAPFFNETSRFLGVVSMDIQLSVVDINQCDARGDSTNLPANGHMTETGTDSEKLVEFLGTHRCKPSTQCKYIPNQGFKRGSYTCECRKGFYFPVPTSSRKAFNGSAVEHAYDEVLKGDPRAYREGFDCLKCSEGCRECVDDSPCLYAVSEAARATLIGLHAVIMVMVVVFAVLVFRYRKHKVIRASSPRFILISIAGVLIMYFKLCFAYPANPSVELCITEEWFYQIGFVTAYSSVIIKTWRVAVIFQVRSARRMALTDAVLIRRVLIIISAYAVFMMVWTSTSPPQVEELKTSEGLFFNRCVDAVWLEVIAIIGQLGMLTWGMYVCYQVRGAPSAYNESKYVSWAIYNAMFVTCFAVVLRFMIRDFTTPDVMFVLEFVFLHSTATTMLLFILIHKFVHIRKVQRVALDCQSANNVLNTVDRMYVNAAQEDTPMTEDQEQLLAQVERLQKKVAMLEAQLNKQTKRQKSTRKLHFGNTLASTSSTEAQSGSNKAPTDGKDKELMIEGLSELKE